MPDIEERVTKLEREVQSIPEILDLQARLNESRFAALFAEIDGIKRKLDGVVGEVKALPRILAEMLAERDRKS
jgi:chromosome segregation ATPase